MNELYMSGFPDAKSTFEWLKLTGNENYCFYGDRKEYRDSLLEKLLLISVLLLAMNISDEQGVIIERSDFIILGLVIFLPIYLLYEKKHEGKPVGYLVNQTESVLHILPVYINGDKSVKEYETSVKGLKSLYKDILNSEKKYADPDKCITVSKNEIEDVKIKVVRWKRSYCFIRINLLDKRKFFFMAIYDEFSGKSLDGFAKMHGYTIQ